MDELCWAEVTRLRETIARVRELHTADAPTGRDCGTCMECGQYVPCLTIRVLDGDEEGAA
jgi:hypothetical protein